MAPDIKDLVYSTPLFDDHDHLWSVRDLMQEEDDYRSIAGNSYADLLVATGPSFRKSPLLQDGGKEHRKAFFHAWRKSRNTGFCRAVEIACKDILGLDFTEENADAVSDRIRGLKERGGNRFYQDLLEKAGIEWVILDSINRPDQIQQGAYPDAVRYAYRDDFLLTALNRDTILQREEWWDRSIHKLSDLVDGLMQSMSGCLATQAVKAVKIGVAYNTGLHFENPTRHDAETAFNHMMSVRKNEKSPRPIERAFGRYTHPTISQLSGEELKPLHDYLTHAFVQRATEEGLPVQVHTGYLVGVNQDLRRMNPLDFVPMLLHYGSTKFDLFHAGWPHTEELAAMGKHYPNAWLSLCWAWAINPVSVGRALDSWLDSVPYTKIIAFGADTKHPITAYGYAVQAREGIARVCESRFARGDADESLSRQMIESIMFGNGRELYGIWA